MLHQGCVCSRSKMSRFTNVVRYVGSHLKYYSICQNYVVAAGEKAFYINTTTRYLHLFSNFPRKLEVGGDTPAGENRENNPLITL